MGIMADDLEEYDMEQDKFMPGKGGKGRSKLEASTHSNHHDPGGQTRKIVTKMQNTEKNRAEAGATKDLPKRRTHQQKTTELPTQWGAAMYPPTIAGCCRSWGQRASMSVYGGCVHCVLCVIYVT